MKITINLPEPKFNLKDKVEFYGQIKTYIVVKRYFVADKRQSIEPNQTLLGQWYYDIGNGEDRSQSELRHYSGAVNKFVVKSTKNYKVVKECDTLIQAIRYIMKNDKSEGWYDLELSHNGYNDIHLWDCIDAYLIFQTFLGNDDNVSSTMDEFSYRLNGNKIHYCEDYESAYELASYLAKGDTKHIIVG